MDEWEIKRAEKEVHEQPADGDSWQEHLNPGLMRRLDEAGPVGDFKTKIRTHAHGHVLDYCCGRGNWGQFASEIDAVESVTGVDISRLFVSQASKKENEKTMFLQGDAEYLPIASGTVDTVLSSLAVHHLPAWPEGVLDELERVLTDSGTIVFREPLAWNPLANVFRVVTETNYRTEWEQPLNPTELRRVLYDRFNTVDLSYHYIAAPGFTVLDDFLPFDVPLGPIATYAKIEKWVLDHGAWPVAVSVVGTVSVNQ